MRFLLPAAIAIPLLFAALAVVFTRSRPLQRACSITGVTLALVVSIVLLVLVERDGIASVTLGGWPAPIGISLVADLLSCLLLVVGLATMLAVLVYADRPARRRRPVGVPPDLPRPHRGGGAQLPDR